MPWLIIIIACLVLALVAQFFLLHRYRQKLHRLDASNQQDLDLISGLRTRLNQAQRLEAVGIYAGSIIHNLNNLLSVIIGHTRLAQNTPGLNIASREELQKAMAAGHVAGDLVADLSNFYRQADLGRKPTALLPIVRDTVKLLGDILPATINIKTDLEPCGPVLASLTGVQQVLMNLCSNAAQTMHQNQGEILVALHEEIIARPQEAMPHQLVPGSYVCLRIKDNGRGMDQDSLARILNSYYTDQPNGENTGLGLATVGRLIQDMQGFAIPKTHTGSGTTFSIYFPLIAWTIQDPPDPLELPEIESLVETGAGGQKKDAVRVLLVDDEEMVAEVLARGLRRLGHQVTAVTDSREALDVFARDPMAFDVIITDQIMPHMSGVRLVREMEKVRSGMPVILTTGFRDSYHERQAREAGVQEFILKPCSHLDLGQAISRLELSRLEGHA